MTRLMGLMTGQGEATVVLADSIEGSTVGITGGTGSFGSTMAEHLLARGVAHVNILSRDEAKQDDMRRRFDDPRLQFFLGDVRDYESVAASFVNTDFVFHAAALKQVPSCEFFPLQAVRTNVVGSHHVVDGAGPPAPDPWSFWAAPPLSLAGLGSLTDAVASLVQRFRFSRRITNHHNAIPAESPGLSPRRSMCLQTSEVRGLGRSLLNAMTSGTPVVSTDSAAAARDPPRRLRECAPNPGRPLRAAAHHPLDTSGSARGRDRFAAASIGPDGVNRLAC